MARVALDTIAASPTIPARDGGRESGAVAGLGERSFGDRIYRIAITVFALCIPLLLALVAWELLSAGWPTFRRFGVSFLTSSDWDPVAGKFGAAPAIYGTIVSSLVALLIAVPLALGVSIFLSELSPRWMRPSSSRTSRPAAVETTNTTQMQNNVEIIAKTAPMTP